MRLSINEQRLKKASEPLTRAGFKLLTNCYAMQKEMNKRGLTKRWNRRALYLYLGKSRLYPHDVRLINDLVSCGVLECEYVRLPPKGQFAARGAEYRYQLPRWVVSAFDSAYARKQIE